MNHKCYEYYQLLRTYCEPALLQDLGLRDNINITLDHQGLTVQ